MCFSWCFGRLATMLEWWEREHELDDALALNDNVMVNVLRECGCTNSFCV